MALITGGTDGVGKATARSLLGAGWEVVITGRSAARCEATVRELASQKVSALVGDLGVMADVTRIARELEARHARLDLLLLNANSISQEHRLTSDGFESNFALGHLGRALLALSLKDLLEKTEGAQVLSVVGLNLERIDFSDPVPKKGFSSMKALGYWQWSIQVFAREWNRRSRVPMNTYMPGLVKTKILAEEPQPFRLIAQVATALFGVSPPRSGDELAQVIDDIAQHGHRDAYYSRTRFKGARSLREQPDDGAKLWDMTTSMLTPFRAT